MSLHRALFLDRDGVINEEVGYLHRIGDVRWVDGIFLLARTARECGYKLVVVTNQSGIARGFYSENNFRKLMDWMRAEFEKQGVPLAGVYYCPYHPEHGVGKYRREHVDRKPGSGMFFRAAKELELDLEQSIMVGDRCSDISAANAAGLLRAFLLAGTESGVCPGVYHTVQSLLEVQDFFKS